MDSCNDAVDTLRYVYETVYMDFRNTIYPDLLSDDDMLYGNLRDDLSI